MSRPRKLMARPKTIPVSHRRFTLWGWIGCTSCLGAVTLLGCASSRHLADAPPTVAPEHSLPIQADAIASHIAVATRPVTKSTHPPATNLAAKTTGQIAEPSNAI